METLKKLTKEARENVLEDAIEAGSPPGDLQPAANECAYEAVDGLIQKGTPPVSKYIRVIESYFDRDPESLEDYNAIQLIEEHYREKYGLTKALKHTAASCVMHSVLDDIEKLGL